MHSHNSEREYTKQQNWRRPSWKLIINLAENKFPRSDQRKGMRWRAKNELKIRPWRRCLHRDPGGSRKVCSYRSSPQGSPKTTSPYPSTDSQWKTSWRFRLKGRQVNRAKIGVVWLRNSRRGTADQLYFIYLTFLIRVSFCSWQLQCRTITRHVDRESITHPRPFL